ncbi:hypothetical protein HK098_000031 [Nowakowskiella sp. JEL0407]|nr:hypothetical protein HK098_000031 [Nowakowskiella sp. JEL0407]
MSEKPKLIFRQPWNDADKPNNAVNPQVSETVLPPAAENSPSSVSTSTNNPNNATEIDSLSQSVSKLKLAKKRRYKRKANTSENSPQTSEPPTEKTQSQRPQNGKTMKTNVNEEKDTITPITDTEKAPSMRFVTSSNLKVSINNTRPDIVPGSSLFFSSLNKRMTTNEISGHLSTIFSEWGKVVSINIRRNNYNNPYGFVQYETAEQADKALTEVHAVDNLVFGKGNIIEKTKTTKKIDFIFFSTNFSEAVMKNEFAFYGKIVEFKVEIFENECMTEGYVEFENRVDAIRAIKGVRGRHTSWIVNWTDDRVSTEFLKEKVNRKGIFVGGLDHSVTKEMLNEKFAKYGTIIRISHEPNQGKVIPGYARLEFSTTEAAINAIKAENNTFWNNKMLRVFFLNNDMRRLQLHRLKPTLKNTEAERQKKSDTPPSNLEITSSSEEKVVTASDETSKLDRRISFSDTHGTIPFPTIPFDEFSDTSFILKRSSSDSALPLFAKNKAMFIFEGGFDLKKNELQKEKKEKIPACEENMNIDDNFNPTVFIPSADQCSFFPMLMPSFVEKQSKSEFMRDKATIVEMDENK